MTGINGLVTKKSERGSRSRRTVVTNKKWIIIHKIRERGRERDKNQRNKKHEWAYRHRDRILAGGQYRHKVTLFEMS